MNTGALILLALGCLVSSLALWMVSKGQKAQERERALSRLDIALITPGVDMSKPDPLAKGMMPQLITDNFISAGIEPNRKNLTIVGGVIFLPAMVAWMARGLGGLVGAMLIMGILTAFWFARRQRQRREKIVAQLPAFLDSVTRVSGVGYSLAISFNSAVEIAEQPLKGALNVAVDMQHAGLDLDEALMRLAPLYKLTELNLIANVVKLAMNYGGKSDILVGRMGQYLRDREQHHKELMALSSEARTSAGILFALTPLIVGLVLIVNPEYLMGMWYDGTGRKLIFSAAFLQCFGGYWMARMVKKI